MRGFATNPTPASGTQAEHPRVTAISAQARTTPWGGKPWRPSASAPQQPASMAAYSPGNASAVQPQSQGTPYSQQFGTTTFNYAPSPAGGTMPAAQQNTPAYYDASGRPAPGPGEGPTFTPSYFDASGRSVSFDQQQAQRAALLQQAMQADMRSQLANTFNQNIGTNAMDRQAMIQRAGDMVDGGFYNPFSAMFGQGPALGGTPSISAPSFSPSPAMPPPAPQSPEFTPPDTLARLASQASPAMYRAMQLYQDSGAGRPLRAGLL